MSEATSRFSGEPETLDAAHNTDYRLNTTQTKDCTQHRPKTSHNTNWIPHITKTRCRT